MFSACTLGSASEAQQIYRWTDQNGKVHFGNQPPQGAMAPQARGREKSSAEIECETAAKQRCHKYLDRWGDWYNSEAYRDCFALNTEKCEKIRVEARPTPAPKRFISTPTLSVEPSAGEMLRCEMRCLDKCQGEVEIRSDRVLKKGENYGTDRYEMSVQPNKAGTAFCTASTASPDVQLVLSVLRNGLVISTVEGQ